MQKKGLKYYSLFATMLFVLPVLLQLFKIQHGFDKIVAVLTYVLIAVSFVYNYVDLKKRDAFAPAFEFDNAYKLDVFSYLVALGFFVEFISNVATLVKLFLNDNGLVISYIVPLIMCALFALLSSFYFVMVGLSFGTKDYDFRSFKLYHIVLLLWAVFKLMTLFGQVIRITYDVNAVLRYLSIMVLAFFFYYFVAEVENNGGANIHTIYCARMCAYCSGFYCLDRLMLLITKQVDLNSNNTYFAITLMFVCLFALFFEKNILHNSTNEE